jgi:hypothetical protein
MKNKKAQFYLVATIIIVGLLVGLSVVFNYSTRASSYGLEKITKELNIEGEKVLDYEAVNPATGLDEFDDFSKKYSAYVGEDKDIYFIIVDEEENIEEAWKYSDSVKTDLSNDLVVDSSIKFTLSGRTYNFKLEEGKNFYFIVVYEKGGESYVYTG